MTKKETETNNLEKLSTVLPVRIRTLAEMVAKKPSLYTPKWAATVEESFEYYTNTSTIMLFQSQNQHLMECGWPFPVYLDIRSEKEKGIKEFGKAHRPWFSRLLLLIQMLSGSSSVNTVLLRTALNTDQNDFLRNLCLTRIFRKHKKRCFDKIKRTSFLRDKQKIIKDVYKSYNRRMWAACITTAIPLLDAVMRDYFKTENLRISINSLSKAFSKAGLRPVDLMPAAFLDGEKICVRLPEEDLRISGVLLSSFFHFAENYYNWHTSSGDSSPFINRHAIIHGDFTAWSEENAAKILTFLNLTLALEVPLRYLISGEPVKVK